MSQLYRPATRNCRGGSAVGESSAEPGKAREGAGGRGPGPMPAPGRGQGSAAAPPHPLAERPSGSRDRS